MARHTQTSNVKFVFSLEELEFSSPKASRGPPVAKAAFRKKPNCRLHVVQWANGKTTNLTAVPSTNRKIMKSVTLFNFAPGNKLLATEYDPRDVNIADIGLGVWPELDGFDYALHGSQVVTLKIGRAQRGRLPPECNCAWTGMLPPPYHPVADTTNRVSAVKGINGSMPALLGLVAMSCPLENQSAVFGRYLDVDNNGRFWRRHPFSSGLECGRIIVVNLHYPSGYSEADAITLVDQFERGQWGAFFDGRA